MSMSASFQYFQIYCGNKCQPNSGDNTPAIQPISCVENLFFKAVHCLNSLNSLSKHIYKKFADFKTKKPLNGWCLTIKSLHLQWFCMILDHAIIHSTAIKCQV